MIADEDLQIVTRLVSELRDADPLFLQIPALDAFSILAVVQFAWRNPALDTIQKHRIEDFGRALQDAIATSAPYAARVLELGWDPTKDRVERKDGSPR
jgi:hypothetical protein